jgi:polyhydroxyalkanoate synthesis regulator phasin
VYVTREVSVTQSSTEMIRDVVDGLVDRGILPSDLRESIAHDLHQEVRRRARLYAETLARVATNVAGTKQLARQAR